MSRARGHLARRRHAALGTILALTLPLASCMRVEITYRDVGQPDARSLDAARPSIDADLDARAPDAAGIDADLDAPRSDVPLPPDTAAATRAVLASVGEHIILAALRDFEARANELVAATDAASASGTPASLDAARAAFRAAMDVWERLEVVQLGPAGLPLYASGGRALRDEIYAWPFVSYCRMDQDLVDGLYESADRLGTEPTSARGLAAIEYALFEPTNTNRCAASATINTSGSWAALGDAEVARRRRVYAHAAAVLVAARARELRLAWDPAGDDFLRTLATAGEASPLFRTAQAGLNALSDALFYLYKEVVDYKIGIPAGIYADCPTDTCPDKVELPWAHASLDAIRINLLAFRDVYLGAPPPLEAPGFDDLLRARGAGELDDRVKAQIAVALAALDAVAPPLEAAVTADRDDVATLHRACRALADLFGVEVLTILDLELPNRVEGDND